MVPGVLLATRFATSEAIRAGGPLGDLVQWADLIAGLHVLGHNVTVMKDMYEAARGCVIALATHSRLFIYLFIYFFIYLFIYLFIIIIIFFFYYYYFFFYYYYFFLFFLFITLQWNHNSV